MTGILTMAAVDHDVDLELGSAIIDQASGTPRDIDITVRYRTAEGVRAVAGIEVKAHTRPLDIEHVEQLVIKLKDVGLHSCAIVSASGYTAAAVKKASAHGVELLSLTGWLPEFERLDTPFRGTKPPLLSEIYWSGGPHVHIELDTSVRLPNNAPSKEQEVWIETHDGGFVRRNVEVLTQQATKRVADLYQEQFPEPTGPSHHEQAVAHRVTLQNQARLIFARVTYPVKFILVSGVLAQSVIDGRQNMRFLARQDLTALVASCCVSEMKDGRLSVMAFDPASRQLTPHTFSVAERTRRKIAGIALARQTEMHRLTLTEVKARPPNEPGG